jgi:FlaA1/EpsC-like NDP-sugar epimerase
VFSLRRFRQRDSDGNADVTKYVLGRTSSDLRGDEFQGREVGLMRVWMTKLGLYVLCWLVALGSAFLFMGWKSIDWQPQHLALTVIWFLIIKSAAAIALGSFQEMWRHTSLEDLIVAIEACLLSSIALLLSARWLLGVPVLFTLADAAATLGLILPLRVAPRVFGELIRPRLRRQKRAIVLAGKPQQVDLELRRMQRSTNPDRIVGLVLDGKTIGGARLKRLRVLDNIELLKMLARRKIQEVTLVPPASPAFATRLEKLCRTHKVPCRSAASLLALGELNRAPEQLLDRTPSQLEESAARAALRGRRILVTGAGGSIGSELSRQLVRLEPEALILADRSENALFHVERAVLALTDGKVPVVAQVVDVREVSAVQRLFARHRPEVIFHAAAHKHVPLMERHPAEAVLNNVGGTLALLEAAHGFGALSFVFVSTDKAVRPSSIMGMTKHLGERCVQGMSRRSETRFMSVRFGNVLGSNGSVLPLFIEQIQQGGPVTVTHPQMERFFMSTAEACKLVLCAASQGRGGELFVLDMGQPMRIVDLAARVIERAGLRPSEDVPIVFLQPRPGEKLSEELLQADESSRATLADGIWSVNVDEEAAIDPDDERLEELLELARSGDDHGVRSMLRELAPGFSPGSTEDEDVEVEDCEPPAPVLASALE